LHNFIKWNNFNNNIYLYKKPVLDRVELSFNADERTAHKHLVAKFDFDKKKSDAYASDLKQQQYQNFYFTLPIFLLIVGLLLNSQRVQQRMAVLRSQIQQSGGAINYLQGLMQSKSSAVEQSQPPQSKAAASKAAKFAQKHQTSRDSDSETAGRARPAARSVAPSTPTTVRFVEPAPVLPAQLSKNDQSDEGSVEESDSVEGEYAIVKNPATTLKRKVNKI
jgi:hypothetical protein